MAGKPINGHTHSPLTPWNACVTVQLHHVPGDPPQCSSEEGYTQQQQQTRDTQQQQQTRDTQQQQQQTRDTQQQQTRDTQQQQQTRDTKQQQQTRDTQQQQQPRSVSVLRRKVGHPYPLDLSGSVSLLILSTPLQFSSPHPPRSQFKSWPRSIPTLISPTVDDGARRCAHDQRRRHRSHLTVTCD